MLGCSARLRSKPQCRGSYVVARRAVDYMSAGRLTEKRHRRAQADGRRAVRGLGCRPERVRRPRLAGGREDVHPQVPPRVGARAVEDARPCGERWPSSRPAATPKTTSASWPAAADPLVATDDGARTRSRSRPWRERFLEDYVSPRKKASTFRLYRLALDGHIVPQLGAVPIADVAATTR